MHKNAIMINLHLVFFFSSNKRWYWCYRVLFHLFQKF